MMKPYIVDRVVVYKNIGKEETITEPEEIGKPISSFTSNQITEMLVSVVENGYAKKVAEPGYSIAAKTGTAQIPKLDGSGYSEEVIHTFVGYAPAYNPRFIGILMINKPQTIDFASNFFSSRL